ncbi:hypothetical protein ACFLZ0_00880 [Patescibacteria group bacterium]
MSLDEKYYLKTGQASDLKSPKERIIYRAFEILPGCLAWLTLIGVIFLSWAKPVWIAFFIIAFDVYWLLKTLYLLIYLRISYRKMRKNIAIDWMKKVESVKDKNWQDIYHLIIMPMATESINVIRPAFQSLINSSYPKDKMIVVLGIEQRVGESAEIIAREIEKDFGSYFYKFLIVSHPKNIEGEIIGKSSNASWAAKRAKREIIDKLKIPYEKVIVSCFDVDTRIYQQYFTCVTYHFLNAKKPFRSSYQPVPVFNNNIWEAPCVSRIVATSGTFWQMMQQQRPERLSTFSSQSISLKALVDVDFWQTNIVSEDSRIFWQCLLYYNGDYRAIPLNYPVSMDANLASTFWKTAVNVYKQQRRWGWGVENVPYLLFGFYKNRISNEEKISWKKIIHWTWVQIEGFWSWSTNALMIFLLGWLPLYLGGQKFNRMILSYNLPRVTRFLMTIAMIGLVGSAIYSALLLPKRPKNQKPIKKISMIIQWILVPITILIFGAVPGLEAQTRLMINKRLGFWVTPKD